MKRLRRQDRLGVSGQFRQKITDGGGWKGAHPNMSFLHAALQSLTHGIWQVVADSRWMSARPVPLEGDDPTARM